MTNVNLNKKTLIQNIEVLLGRLGLSQKSALLKNMSLEKINEMYEGDDLDFDMSVGGDSETDFEQEAMQVQLMKIEDSEDHPDIKNPIRTVKTDDGKQIRVERPMAVALMKILKMQMPPDTKMKIMKDIQNSAGLEKMMKFCKAKGLVK